MANTYCFKVYDLEPLEVYEIVARNRREAESKVKKLRVGINNKPVKWEFLYEKKEQR